MAKNNVDQAPKIKSKGEKSPAYLKEGRSAWGSAIRPHELETIFANCLGAKAFSQYKIMMFLTGNAEEKAIYCRRFTELVKDFCTSLST